MPLHKWLRTKKQKIRIPIEVKNRMKKKKQATKLKTEWTEFCKIITNKELKKSPDEKIINNIFNGVNEKKKSNIKLCSERGI